MLEQSKMNNALYAMHLILVRARFMSYHHEGRDSEKRLISNKGSDKLFFKVCAKKKSLVRGVHHCTSRRMA